MGRPRRHTDHDDFAVVVPSVVASRVFLATEGVVEPHSLHMTGLPPLFHCTHHGQYRLSN